MSPELLTFILNDVGVFLAITIFVEAFLKDSLVTLTRRNLGHKINVLLGREKADQVIATLEDLTDSDWVDSTEDDRY